MYVYSINDKEKNKFKGLFPLVLRFLVHTQILSGGPPVHIIYDRSEIRGPDFKAQTLLPHLCLWCELVVNLSLFLLTDYVPTESNCRTHIILEHLNLQADAHYKPAHPKKGLFIGAGIQSFGVRCHILQKCAVE